MSSSKSLMNALGRSRFLTLMITMLLLLASTSAWTSHSPSSAVSNRREALKNIVVASSAAAFLPNVASALDMDAFANSELASDTKNCDPKKDPKCAPEMTKDEALCKYGQSGDARGEACKRFKAAGGSLNKQGSSQGKSLGGAYAI